MECLYRDRNAMTIKYNFVWIDDNVKRASGFQGAFDGSLRNSTVETKLEVIGVTANLLTDLSVRVEQWLETPPNMILLDHNFSTVPQRLFDIHGSALAHLLRIQLPNIPMVCVSGQSIRSDEFNAEDLSEYTYLFDVNQINSEENLERLFAIAEDFKLICFPNKQPARKAIVDLLAPPDVDRTSLISILPDEFEDEYIHGVSPHRIARWILNVFMRHQGFLYDSLETATLLGLSEKAFTEKVKQFFDSSRYKGPFATESNPLWWASAITDDLYRHLPDHIALLPQEAGRKFDGIVEADFSRCAVTNEHSPPPDVVAFTDATESERKAVHHNYAEEASESASSLLGFATRLRIRNSRRGT